jgi:hypothetical protein
MAPAGAWEETLCVVMMRPTGWWCGMYNPSVAPAVSGSPLTKFIQPRHGNNSHGKTSRSTGQAASAHQGRAQHRQHTAPTARQGGGRGEREGRGQGSAASPPACGSCHALAGQQGSCCAPGGWPPRAAHAAHSLAAAGTGLLGAGCGGACSPGQHPWLFGRSNQSSLSLSSSSSSSSFSLQNVFWSLLGS